MNAIRNDADSVLDTLRIQNVVSKSIVARDRGDWARFAEFYHPEAVITTSWFSGTPAAFVERSKTMKIARHPGESQKHVTSNFSIEIAGDRAVSECDLILYQRRLIDGVELDFTTWSRRLDLLEIHEGSWKIRRWTMIYEKDRVDAVRPEVKLDALLRPVDFSAYPQEIRYHCWRNATIGFPPAATICIQGSDREDAVRDDSRRWLAASTK